MNNLELRLIRKTYLCHTKTYSKSVNLSGKWKSVVGLEVHAQINSKSKLFSGATNEFASPINSNVSLFDCAIPGTLPVLNKRCVEVGVLTALALNCKVNPVSSFDRKHYFYADMPAGYQITQQRSPLAIDGHLNFEVYTPGFHRKPYTVKTKIKQLQLEQDSGKSLHEDARSLVDLNRAGAPLMELVFEPDLSDGEEAAALIKELVNILQRIGSCTCKMEEGALRVDANISVHQIGDPLGTRTEVKNIGSIRGVASAVKYEIERQIKLLDRGVKVLNETRAWDAINKTTVAMRDKEQLQDYRYMPEPNLPPLHVAIGPVKNGCVNVSELQKMLPELPEETRTRLKNDYGLTSDQAIILVNEPTLLTMFEDALKGRDIEFKLLANLLINDFLTFVHKEKLELEKLLIPGNIIGEICRLVQCQTINRNTAKLVLGEILIGDKDSPTKIIRKHNWVQINGADEITAICQAVISENPKIVQTFKEGKTKLFKALLGCVAAKTDKRANMAIADEILKKLLK